MTRDIYIRTKTFVRRCPLGKNVRPMTIVSKHFYRTDETLMVASTAGPDEFVMYDIEGTQPYFAKVIVSPDETMALQRIAKSGGRQVSTLSALNSINPSWIIYGVIGFVIIYAVLTGGVIS